MHYLSRDDIRCCYTRSHPTCDNIPELTFFWHFGPGYGLDHSSPLWFVAGKGKTTTSPLRPQSAFLSSSDARLRIEPGILYHLRTRTSYPAIWYTLIIRPLNENISWFWNIYDSLEMLPADLELVAETKSNSLSEGHTTSPICHLHLFKNTTSKMDKHHDPNFNLFFSFKVMACQICIYAYIYWVQRKGGRQDSPKIKVGQNNHAQGFLASIWSSRLISQIHIKSTGDQTQTVRRLARTPGVPSRVLYQKPNLVNWADRSPHSLSRKANSPYCITLEKGGLSSN